MKRFVLNISLVFSLLLASGQEDIMDSVLRLPTYEVVTSRLDDFSAGQKVRRIDTLTLQESASLNLGEMIQRSSAVHVNTYGFNGLSSIAFRGTSVTHTGFYWNGFSLSPPNNGQVDMALIPAGFFNDVRIHHGGGSALLGSGNIGGSIHLNNQADFSRHLKATVGLHVASFGQAGGEGSFSTARGKWFSRTTLIGKKARNDFPFEDLQKQTVHQENGELLQYGLMQDLYFQAGRGWVAGASFWLQDNHKEIPATMTSKPSDAWQADRSYRSMLSAKKYYSDGLLSIKTGLLYDYLHYVDPDTLKSLEIDSEIRTLRSVTEAQMEKRIHRNILINGGLSYTAEQGESGNYEGRVTQQQLGLFAQWLQDIPGIAWKMNINLRQDLISHYRVPFTPSFGMEGKLYKIVSAKLNISRNFRVPTFNDRYWIPGGNEDLLPESSWNEEVSLIFDMNMEAFRNKTWMIFTAYNSNVNDWILWVPDGSLWTAENVQRVWSRGLEAEYRSAFSIGQVTISFIGGYTYAKSTNEARQGNNDNSYQKQLIYVPMHRYFFTGSLLVHGFVLSYNQSRNGERYTTKDNSEKLPGYTLANLIISKSLHPGNQSLDLSFEVANLWDAEYQAIQYYQMPGRNYKISLTFKFNKKRNDKIQN